MTNSYHGMNIVLLNRGYNTVIQTININNSPSAWYWGSWSNGQLWVFQVRGRPDCPCFRRPAGRRSVPVRGTLTLIKCWWTLDRWHSAGLCHSPHKDMCRWCQAPTRLWVQLISLLVVLQRFRVGLQAHAGFTGSPDSDPSPTFTQVASNLAIKNWSLTVTLPPVSLSVICF